MKHLAAVILFGGAYLLAAEPAGRYALILNDEPVAVHLSSLKTAPSAAPSYRQQVRAAQIQLEQQLQQRNFQVTGAVQTVLNAVFVRAPKSRVAELQALPGVKQVAPLHRFHRTLDRAVELVNAPAAWSALGGAGNAGAGVKIAIIDTGIDQNHPAFKQAPPVPTLAGFPKCAGSDCAFTNSKVIVARSYIAGEKPDDVSPRDHVGHGTAVAMIAAGSTNTAPLATITGMAPQAWLGNYKVFGSPGVNEFAFGDALITAIDDAVNDGMDIAVMSLGSPAEIGPLDTGAVCGNSPGQPCDAEALAVDNAVKAGMLIATSTGNSGFSGAQVQPSLNTIESPATAPSAIAVGASTNGHMFVNSVRVPGSDVPRNLENIPAVFGDGPLPSQPLTAPAIDVAKLDNTGLACIALPPHSLDGAIALVQRSQPNGCLFVDKVSNVQSAGGVGVIFIQRAGQEDLIVPGGLTGTSIPSAIVGSAEGQALKGFVDGHPGHLVTMDATGLAAADAPANTMAYFSSRGPSITYLLKPELVAVGTNIYTAAESYDPNGVLYDPSGYTVGSGTSFSAPMVAGGAALVKEKMPHLTGLQLKSAVVNTATEDVTENGSTAGITAMGNGKLDAGAAIQTTVTVNPATISFGALGQTAGVPASQNLAVHYSGTTPVTLSLSISGANAPAMSPAALTFTPGQADQAVTLSLAQAPPAGMYSGAITITGGPVPLRVPYLYVVGDRVPNNLIALSGDGFDETAGQSLPEGLAFKVVDQYGVAVQNVPVTFTASQGGGQIRKARTATDGHGVAFADAVLGPAPGKQEFTAQAGGLEVTFSGVARAVPVVSSGGVVNAASFQMGRGVAPGSYVSIFGSQLSDTTAPARALPLPLAISETSVSFSAGGRSLPAPMVYASPSQLNVQAPWELAGQSSATIEVHVSDTTSASFTVALAPYSPALFELSSGTAAAEDAGFNVITSTNLAKRGQVIHLFTNGLGAVNNTPPDGAAASASPLSTTVATPTVTIGGVRAAVSFSGLAPDFPGLYQIDVIVPATAPTGNQRVVISIGGVSSPSVNLPVQ